MPIFTRAATITRFARAGDCRSPRAETSLPRVSASPRLDVDVRAYRDGDRAGVRALLARTFTEASIFDRFAEGNPLGAFVAAVAEHAGAVVGFNMWNPWLVHTAGGPA